jgi:hypothetical protein
MFVSCEFLCCQVEVSATGRSLVQRSPTDCDVCVRVRSSEHKQPRHLLSAGRRGKEYETKGCLHFLLYFKHNRHESP